MGAVYEGVNGETGESAAVKILASSLAGEEGFRQRFEAEIEALRMLRHPNIVRLFGFGEQEGLLYYAMELVDGPSLEQELRNGRRFTWRETARIGIDTCRALRHAHDRGIIHRDIKPANLLLTAADQIKLSDFGIARLFGNSRLTTVGNVLGTVEFMAPEQADARPAGPRADLYSLGGVMFALLSGRAPFRAKSLAEMLDKQRSAQPEAVSRLVPEVPRELDEIILQLLAKDPEARIPNATILARRLEAMVHALSRPAETARDEADTEQRSTPAAAPGSIVHVEAATDPSAAPREPAPVDPFLPTRLSDDLPDPAETIDHPVAPAEDLPETRQTSAFRAFLPASPLAKPPEPVTSVDRFTSVPEEELGKIHRDEPRERPLVSLHTWVLAAALSIVGLSTWYLLRPASADALYERISVTTASHSIKSYRQAEADIGEFLMRYPHDPRAAGLREYSREIELDKLETRFELRAKGLLASESLLPVETAYLEAINCTKQDPSRGAAKLQALLDLFGPHGQKTGPKGRRAERAGPTAQCLELARRRLKQLGEQIDRSTSTELTSIQSRLDQADALSVRDPDAARAMRRAGDEG
jgi:serine/threonine-protein kinase